MSDETIRKCLAQNTHKIMNGAESVASLTDDQASRRQAIHSAVRDWIVPALVARFLSSQGQPSAQPSDTFDGHGVGKANPPGRVAEGDLG